MLSLYLSAFVLGLALAAYTLRTSAKNRKLPPGPIGLPVLGYLPFLDVFHLGASFKQLGKRFGDIFSLRVGTELAVVLNSESAIRSAMSLPSMLSRPDTFMFRFFSHGQNGIASASGEKWEVQRKFTHSALKTFGFGNKARMQGFLQEEVECLVTLLEGKAATGKPVEIGYDVNVSIVNVLWAMISGERRPHDDQKLRDFLTAVNSGIELASTSGILLFMPFLIKVLPERLFKIDQVRKWMKNSYSFLQETVDDHKAAFVAGEPSTKDFIDAFLNEMRKDGAHESFNEFQLLVLCSELFGAGGEPTSVTLKWAIHFLATHPEIQAKAQAEIDSVVGKDRFITLEDGADLPYIQAVVMDSIRHADIHPIGVMHGPSEDTYLDGYLVPKGAFVFPNYHAVHTDPKHWEKPEDFYPEHWIDTEGKFNPKHEGFLSFGVGKRNCPGQDVALMELFSFIANLLQRFNFKLPEGASCKLEATAGCVVSPKPYDIVLESRC